MAMRSKIPAPPDPQPFYSLVWEITRQIPPGKVFTYGQIAILIPAPAGIELGNYKTLRARWVGDAMASSPPDVPWQRVINAQGKISLGRGSLQKRQRQLLESEGVIFDKHDRVNLELFGWSGPSAEWCREHGLPPPPDHDLPGYRQGSLI